MSLQMLTTVGPKSSVPDSIFAAVGSLATALEEDFGKYMESFVPFLYNALGNLEEVGLCAMAIGLVSDIVRSLGENCQPYCDTFMNYLLSDLRVRSPSGWTMKALILILRQNPIFANQLKPAVLQCFGDIAQAIGVHFEKYLETTAQVLEAAANVTRGEPTYDMFDYMLSLSEGVMDAWGGIILALKQTKGRSRCTWVLSRLTICSPIA